jgi:glycosyltransferase involved in cell wall biosynthesis
MFENQRMANSRSRVLFLCQSASRNGATILLLDLLRWLKRETKYDIQVLVNGPGALLDELRAVGPTRVWRSPAFFLETFPRKWKAALGPRVEALCLRAFLRGRRYDLVYANTSATWQNVAALGKSAGAVLWHIHELGYALRLTIGEQRIRQVLPLAKRFVAVSQAVRESLTGEFNVPSDRVDLVHGFVPIPNLALEERQLKRGRIRRELGWDEKVFVVGGCGAVGWRKGTDLFLQAASALRKAGRKEVGFLWVGGERDGKEGLEFDHDIHAMDLQGSCKWVTATADVQDYYCAMDAFALTSREDPFPLVMLEAGALGLPMVCFAKSGGGPEFAGSGAGLVAPYLDVEALAGHLAVLHDNADLRRQLGAEAARQVRTNYTVDQQAPKVLRCIERCLQPG